MSNAFRELAKQRQQPEMPQRNPALCYADHCPCMGSVSLEGGHFTCTAHACVPADQWPRVTESLHTHRWLIALIDDLADVERRREKDGPGWREYATKFWTGTDDHCLPDAKEEMLPYQNRMRGELLWRCKLGKRPAPRLPQVLKARGNAASFLNRGAA